MVGATVASTWCMSKWVAIVLLVGVVACSKKKEDMPQSCFEVLDCCSSLGRDLEDSNLSKVKYMCEDAKRFAAEGSEAKCDLATTSIMADFWTAYPSRSMGPTCEAMIKR
jgi:hypothetical protein